MSRFTRYFKDEFVGKLFSSKKKIIKFVAISFVPFLYGFVCVYAFWDPVSNIGKVPMAIVDNSKRIDLVVGSVENCVTTTNPDGTSVTKPSGKPQMVIGEAGPMMDVPSCKDPSKVEKHQTVKIKNLGPDASSNPYIYVPLTTVYSYKKDFSFVESFIKGWDGKSQEDSVISQNPNGTYNIIVSESNPLNNVSYFNNYDTSIKADTIAEFNPSAINPVTDKQGAWEVTNEDYWLQIQVPGSFNEIFATTLASMYNYSAKNPAPEGCSWSDQLSQLKNSPINIWTTFKKNFLFGQFMKVFNELKSAMVVDFYPRLIVQTMVNLIQAIYEDKKQEFIFTPKNDINIPNLEVDFHNLGTTKRGVKKISHYSGPVNIPAGQSVIIRNNEFRDAIAAVTDPAQISEADKANILTRKTYEGNTIELIGTQNDWTITPNISYIDLIVSIVKPIAASLFPETDPGEPSEPAAPSAPTTYDSSSDHYASALPMATLAKYLENKMFVTHALERDPNLKPVKNIISMPTDIAANTAIDVITKAVNLPVIFSNNTKLTNPSGTNLGVNEFIASQSTWAEYNNQLSSPLKELLTQLVESSKPGYNPQAPPAEGDVTSSMQNDELVTGGVIGEQYSVYGIGLGQFFLFISIWVGVLMLTFVLDRKRRGAAAHPELLSKRDKKKGRKPNWWTRFKEAMDWWWSKIVTMLIMVTIQVTILSLTIFGLGYHVLGSTFLLLYLQLLFSGYVFVFFIGALWFFFRDDVIGKFIAILFLIINLSSGWGTFPPIMQFPIFEVLSYIAPFTYSIKNIGAIVYGVGIVGSNWPDASFILGNCGISLIYLFIGLFLGFFGSMRLTKMQFYGSRNKKKLAIAILEMNNAIFYPQGKFLLTPYWDMKDPYEEDDLMKYILTETIFEEQLTTSCYVNVNELISSEPEYNWEIISQLPCIKMLPSKKDPNKIVPEIDWDFLPYGYDKAICDYYNNRFPFEEKLKFWKRKHSDFIEIEDCVL